MTRMISFVAIAAMLAGCGGKKKEKDKDKDEPAKAGSGSGSSLPAIALAGSGSGSSAGDPTPGTKGSDAVGPTGKGCEPPAQITGDYTITKKCDVKIAESLDVAENGSLTIEEGAKLAFPKERHLDVEGKLVVKGTAEAPVVFTSGDASPNPGDWDGIRLFATTRAGTSIDHAKIEFAGYTGTHGSAGVHLLDELPPNRVSITNSEIARNAAVGLLIDGRKTLVTKLEGNTFTTDDKVAISAPADVWTTIGVNSIGDQVARVNDGTFTRTGSWPSLNGVYVIDDNLFISGKDAPVLTLPDAATVRVAKDKVIRVGFDDGGGLVARKVTFTSAATTQDEGDWGGLVIEDKAANTVIDGCTIEFAGGNSPYGAAAVVLHAPIATLAKRVTFTHNTIQKSMKNGIDAPEANCGVFVDPASGNKAECLK